MTDQLKNRIKELESRLAVLELENNSLSERKEEMLLLGLVSEVASHAQTIEELVNISLERVSILKEIAFCYCGKTSKDKLETIGLYCSTDEKDELVKYIQFPLKLKKTLDKGLHITSEKSVMDIIFDLSQHCIAGKSAIIIPWDISENHNGVFIFADENRSATEIEPLSALLQRITEMIVSRARNLLLVNQLQDLNDNLDREVTKRSNQVSVAHTELKQQLEIQKRTAQALKNSEDKLKQLFNNTNDAIYLWPLEEGNIPGKCIEVNDAATQMLGYSRVEFMNMKPADIQIDTNKSKIPQIVQNIRRKGKDTFELIHQTKDGRKIPVEVSSHLFRFNQQEVIISVVRNISTRKQTEQALADMQRLSESILLATPSIIFIFDMVNQHITFINDNVEKALGISPDEVYAKGSEFFKDLMHPDDYNEVMESMKDWSQLTENEAVESEHRLKTESDEYRWFGFRSSIFEKSDDESIMLVIGSAQDIHTQKMNEISLRESEEKYRNLVERANDGITIISEGTIVYCNQQLAKLYGDKVEKIVGKPFAKYIHPGELPKIKKRYVDRIAGKKVKDRYETIAIDEQKNERNVELSAGVISYKGKPADLVIVRDISERKKAEIAIKESEERYRSLIEQSNDGYFLFFEERLELVNRKFRDLFGLSEEDIFSGDFDVLELIHPNDRMRLKSFLNDSDEITSPFEIKALNSEGKMMTTEMSITRINYKNGAALQGIIRDITERKILEEQLQQAQKMESIGQLAAGVAHDFNNLLTVINGYSEMLLAQFDSSERCHHMSKQIFDAGQRASSLTNQLLAFSRKQIIEPRVVNLNDLVTQTEKMLRRLIGEPIQLTTTLGTELFSVRIDPAQLDQIMMNLAVNARDAMPNGGQLIIKTSSVIYEKQDRGKHSIMPSGSYTLLEFSDNGIGMDEETQTRIFEPFFTTKKAGEGTGLGLATVYGIIKQNNGFVWIESELAIGTTFKIYFPAIRREELLSSNNDDDETKFAGSETIIVVEDNESVRDLVCNILSDNGYKVISADSPEDAIHIVKSGETIPDILITDVVMPHMNGKELYDILIKLLPDLKVLFMSGYTTNVISHHGVLDEGINFVQKPISIGIFLQKLRDVINSEK